MPRESIPELGTRNDAARRRNLRRQNGHALSHKVKIARKAIYESGKGVKSAAVENLLSFGSYVPTEVSQISNTCLIHPRLLTRLVTCPECL